MQLGVGLVLVGQRNSLTSESRSLHLLHGLGASADARGDAPGRAAKPVLLGVQAAPSGRRGMGNPAAMKRFCRVPVGGPGHGMLRRTGTSKQAGQALRSQGHPHAHVM